MNATTPEPSRIPAAKDSLDPSPSIGQLHRSSLFCIVDVRLPGPVSDIPSLNTYSECRPHYPGVLVGCPFNGNIRNGAPPHDHRQHQHRSPHLFRPSPPGPAPPRPALPNPPSRLTINRTSHRRNTTSFGVSRTDTRRSRYNLHLYSAISRN